MYTQKSIIAMKKAKGRTVSGTGKKFPYFVTCIFLYYQRFDISHTCFIVYSCYNCNVLMIRQFFKMNSNDRVKPLRGTFVRPVRSLPLSYAIKSRETFDERVINKVVFANHDFTFAESNYRERWVPV